jgi:ABC-2 type transport system ATP-binding protein
MRFRSIAEPAARQGARAEPVDLLKEPDVREVDGRPGERPASANLVMRGVTKHWRLGLRRQSAPVLNHVDFELAPGEAVWVGGRNGVGKTTLLRLIAGVFIPDSGTVRLQGLDPDKNRRRYQSRIGYLSAGNTGLIARLSGRYQLKYWSYMAFVPGSEREAAIDRAIDAFDLHELAKQRVDRMSMGQRQRIRAAMVFLHSPEVVLLDEPLTSLDDEGAVLLSRAIREVTGRGGSVVSCSPGDDLDRLDFDRRCVIEGDRLVAG